MLLRREQTAVETPASGLSSPRFAGDPILEACYADQGRLTLGATGPSVIRVQQALLDLHYDLGPAGADGQYGPATWKAVKRFKATERLGWESMGDVGPGTMHRLDELFRDEPPPPDPHPDTDAESGIDVTDELPILASPDRAGGGTPLLGFVIGAGAAQPAVGGGNLGVPTAGAVKVGFQNSLHETIFSVTRWMHEPNKLTDEQKAAEAVRVLLADPQTTYTIKDSLYCKGPPVCPASRERYEEWVRLKEHEVVLSSAAIDFLCQKMGVTRPRFDDAADAQRKYGGLMDKAELWKYFGQDKLPVDPKDARQTSDRAGQKRLRVFDNVALLGDPELATLYRDLMKSKVGDVDESQIDVSKGLTPEQVAHIVGGDPKKRYLTEVFTQGVKEYRDAGFSDIKVGFALLEASLWDQIIWGNPTATRNELRVGIGKPERALGLIYIYDGMLYYDAHGNPLPSFSGAGYRDPGFKGTAKDPGFLNLAAINDETLQGFLKLLHDNFKTPALIVGKGAEAYWKNMGDVNAVIREGLDDAIKDELEASIEVLVMFLLWRGLAMALERQPHPWLKAIGAGMEAVAIGLGYALDIEFLGTTEEKLVLAGFHLAKVVPKNEKGEMDEISKLEMRVAAGIIRPMIAQIATMIILKAGEKVARGPKPKAKAEFKRATKEGGRSSLECTYCWLRPRDARPPPLRYRLKPGFDVDWRGTGKSHQDALAEAFRRTGIPRDQFEVTMWARSDEGKTIPVEWTHKGKGGGEVSMDWPHDTDGPDAPHIGWVGPKRAAPYETEAGHIMIDDVPAGRSKDKAK